MTKVKREKKVLLLQFCRFLRNHKSFPNEYAVQQHGFL